MFTRKASLAVAVAAVLAVTPVTAHAVMVDVQLALLVDVSGSINAAEYALQLQGYVDAFNSPAVYDKIAATDNGIAVTMVQWSGKAQQAQVIGWTHLTDQASSQAFAAAIAGTTRQYGELLDLTAPGTAVAFITPQFASNGFEGTVKTIDISSDGTANSGDHPITVDRDAAAVAGIGINCLAIETEVPNLADYYYTYMQTGANSFTTAVSSFDDIGDTLLLKIAAEVPGDGNTPPPPPVGNLVPEPLTVAGVVIGLAALGNYIRRRRMAAA